MLLATVALAANFQCSDRRCYGTALNDINYERGGNGVGDTIYGLGGDDRINASTFGGDEYYLLGRAGNDRLVARNGDGRDLLMGYRGFDRCFGGPGDPYRDCEVINGVVQ
jgi:Ca2+-binding RTX toxin-like protein